MDQTKEGAKKAIATIKEKYGDNYYKEIGAKGGKACVCKGFGTNHKLAQMAGMIGGRISKRGPAKNHKEN